MGTALRRNTRPTRAPFVLLSAVFLAGLWLAAMSGVTEAEALELGPPVSQCNDMANVGATTTTCEVTITNNITYNADGTSTTASVIVTTVNGVTNSTTATTPITEIDQCNETGKDGASTVTCTSTITNNITGAPASAAVLSTINQCNPLLGAPTKTCTATPAGPNETDGYQAIGQCNRSGATGTVTCTATAGEATDAAPMASIDQCNGSGTTGASTVTCTATLTNTFACPGTTTTLANGACSAATTTTTGGATTSTTSATSPTTPTTEAPGGPGGTTPTTTPGGTSPASGGPSGVATETTIDSTGTSSRLGQTVGFTATVAGPAGTPTGSVTFFDGSTELGTVPLIGGRATLWTSELTVGDHDITVRFDQTASHRGSTSEVIKQTVSAVADASDRTGASTRTRLPLTGVGSLMPQIALGLVLLVAGLTVRSARSTTGEKQSR